MSPFEEGQAAFAAGKTEQDNPYICGQTKLGNTKFAEGGQDWLAGWIAAKPVRKAGKAEIEAAARVDVSRFRRKSNRYYGK